MMKRVAEHLAKHASELKDIHEMDVFGRSAFNRYYYSCFLACRDMLRDFDSKWSNTSHKHIPDLLQSAVLRRIKDTATKQQRAGLLNHSDYSRMLHRAQEALSNLAGLLGEAYQVRVIADYYPEIPISKKYRTLYLENKSLEEATKWTRRTDTLRGTITQVWQQLGL